ncbi:MAG: OsmC family protein [Chloroflexota bacterium]
MLKISAQVKSRKGDHEVNLETNGAIQSIEIVPKAGGYGSSVNGGELMFLALATCYCNDIYREAKKRGIKVHNVQVEVTGDFNETAGSRAENITYKALVEAEASEDAILELMQYTDTVAEIHNTLRAGISVTLTSTTAISI